MKSVSVYSQEELIAINRTIYNFVKCYITVKSQRSLKCKAMVASSHRYLSPVMSFILSWLEEAERFNGLCHPFAWASRVRITVNTSKTMFLNVTDHRTLLICIDRLNIESVRQFVYPAKVVSVYGRTELDTV